MDRITFDYSTKNIPNASRSAYLKWLIEKTELLLKRVRWKSFFFLNPKTAENKHENYGFNSQKSLPAINKLKDFEEAMSRLIQTIKFEDKPNEFQKKLYEDLKTVKDSDKLTVKADKTTNYYKMDCEKYKKLVNSNVTKTYKKTDRSKVQSINREAKRMAEYMNISDRLEKLAEKEVFINLKDHKPNFESKPTCRLISPTKAELGYVSNQYSIGSCKQSWEKPMWTFGKALRKSSNGTVTFTTSKMDISSASIS